MAYIYLMDTKIPVPEDYEQLPFYKEIRQNSMMNLDRSYTQGVLSWLQEEMRKVLESRGIFCTPSFLGISATFYKNVYINEPKQSFFPESNMIAIGLSRGDCGKESDLQRPLIHEGTHASMADARKVGIAVSEGLALLIEEWWCKFYGVPVQQRLYPPNYQFSKKLMKKILKNVYQGNETRMIASLQNGKEDIFLKDLDDYFKARHLPLNSGYFTVFSSLLFWAKQDPKTIFDNYHVSAPVKRLQKEILHGFDRPSLALLSYQGVCEEIERILEETSEQEISFASFRATFERGLGELLNQDAESFKTGEKIPLVYYETCDLVGYTSPSSFTKRLLR